MIWFIIDFYKKIINNGGYYPAGEKFNDYPLMDQNDFKYSDFTIWGNQEPFDIENREVEKKTIYNYREMLFNLVKKDLRTRYKGSVLGFLWTFINPLLQLLVYSIVFSIISSSFILAYLKYIIFIKNN